MNLSPSIKWIAAIQGQAPFVEFVPFIIKEDNWPGLPQVSCAFITSADDKSQQHKNILSVIFGHWKSTDERFSVRFVSAKEQHTISANIFMPQTSFYIDCGITVSTRHHSIRMQVCFALRIAHRMTSRCKHFTERHRKLDRLIEIASHFDMADSSLLICFILRDEQDEY